jgi:hypothetical protein
MTTEQGASSELPPRPAADGAENLHKDEVTGEMISKSERAFILHDSILKKEEERRELI